MGPDLKIYQARYGVGSLGVIDTPNMLGAGCNYNANGCYLDGKTSWFGQPTFVNSIYNGSAILTASTSSTSPSCNGQCTGAITANPTGGTVPYAYLWSNTQTSPTATGLCAGTYTVTVTDATGTQGIDSAIVTELPPLLIATSCTPALCNTADGQGCVTVSGALPPITYVWDNGSTDACASGLGAGSYAVTVVDANGCSETASLCIPGSAPIVSSIWSNICSGDSLFAQGGWQTAVGTYYDTLIATVGCNNIIVLNLGLTVVDTSVSASPAMLVANASGATYKWLDRMAGFTLVNGETGQAITPSANGTGVYAVQVTQNGCTDISACYALKYY